WSDTPPCPCRTPRSSEATCAVENVAPDSWVVRHAPPRMSLGASGWSDIVVDACRAAHEREATRAGRPCRPSRARRATCKGLDVALPRQYAQCGPHGLLRATVLRKPLRDHCRRRPREGEP